MQFFDRLFARAAARVSSRARGFTLIELLIVIVIIGILAVGFAPTVLNAPKKARDAVRKGHLASIKQAIEAFAVDNGGYPVPDTYCLANAAKFTVNGVDKTTEFKSYFQGGVIPNETQGSNKLDNSGSCSAASYGYRFPDNGCYVLIAKMEVSKAGNSDVLPLNSECKNKLTDNSGDYYYLKTVY